MPGGILRYFGQRQVGKLQRFFALTFFLGAVFFAVTGFVFAGFIGADFAGGFAGLTLSLVFGGAAAVV